MRGARRAVLALALGLVGMVTPTLAEEPEGELVVEVVGKIAMDDNIALSLRFGKSVTKAVKVYCEPSHTLLVAVADQDFAATQEGNAWRSAHEGAAALVESALPDSRPTVVIPRYPEEDTRIAVWVHGDLLGDGSKETLVADAVAGPEFSFSTRLSPAGGFQHCCSGGGCGTMCVSCK